ncbi:MAG: hypothetical protein MMC23_009344 [Stictis urceolatum]|nr:hypothetical protein [Stictis urceolata]
MQFYTTTFISLLLRATNAHIILENPQPFAWPADGHFNPINPDGSDYPCKIPPGGKLVPAGPSTKMAIGAPQTLSFNGTAVHGGGSCQLSLTKDIPPTKDSEFIVIQSIEGGCPARNRAGNLDPGQNPDTYQFSIPDGIEPGDYAFAWTWNNRIGGSPEFYMNCAPITVTGGSKKRNIPARRAAAVKRAEFPPVFLSNIGDVGGGCVTSEAHDLQHAIAYPNSGPSVERPNGDADLFKMQCDGNPKAKAPGGDSGWPTSASSTPDAAPPSQATPSLSSSPVADSDPASTADPTSAADVQPTVQAFTFASSSAASIASAPSTPSGTCTESHFNCIDGTSFSICTGGVWTSPQPFPQNSRCKVGESATLAFDKVDGISE